MSVATYTKTGTKATAPAKLDKKVFGLDVDSHELIKQAYLAYLAGGRTAGAKTKKRGEVSGGGQKPWRQKGTGRARFGSSRNPIWRGGGVAFGPTGKENYSQKLNKQAKRLALKQALSLSATEGRVKVIEGFPSAEGRTKPASALLAKLGASANTVIVTSQAEPNLELALRNIPAVSVIRSNRLTVYHVVNAAQLIFVREAIAQLSERLGDSK